MTRVSIHSATHATFHLAPWLAWLLGVSPDRELSRYVSIGGGYRWCYAATGHDVPEGVARLIDSEERKRAVAQRIAKLQRGT